MLSNKGLSILIAEDSDEDFDLLLLAFKRFGITNNVIRIQRGEEIMPLLQKMHESEGALPGLILLDLNLIGLDGREVLKHLKASLPFKRIPVVVLSTSSSPKDVEVCYAEGANSYSVKPVDLEKFENFVALIKQYWLENAILPRPSPLDLVRSQHV